MMRHPIQPSADFLFIGYNGDTECHLLGMILLLTPKVLVARGGLLFRVRLKKMTAEICKVISLNGDGIGPEIVKEAIKCLSVLNRFTEKTGKEFTFEAKLIGGAAIDACNDPLPEDTLEACRNANAILLGAVGGPKWPSKENPLRPEQGLLKIRKELDLFANIRPCFFPSKSLIDRSPLKPEVVQGVEFTVVRELTGGIYFGDRVEETADGIAHDRMTYSVPEVQRIARVAGNLAMLSSPPTPITSIDKANVLATSRLWRRVVTETIEKEFPAVPLSHNLVDSAAMVMVMNPRKLNGIILTENMFGDILSDESSVIPGSLGLLPSASLNGTRLGLFEPIHGSAPDIAGQGIWFTFIQGIANPVGTILSAAMMLEMSFGMIKEAKALEKAVAFVLDEKMYRTKDLGGEISTIKMGDAIAQAFHNELNILY